MGQGSADLIHGRDSGHLTYLVVHLFRNVHCDVAAVALGPSLLPKVTSYLGHLVDCGCEGRTVFKNTLHNV